MMMNVSNDWRGKLQEEWRQPYMQELLQKLEERYNDETALVYPKREHLLRALELTSYADAKVLVLGQDPYHGPGQAHGLSFSVPAGVKLPPSLRNIFKELEADVGCPAPRSGDLELWARQGVLLLNTVLTVEDGQAGSHQGMGWERFTDRIISLLNEREQPVVFVLWGKHAEKKTALIDTGKHPVIVTAHPSPLSAHRGFFGSRPFSRINGCLQEIGAAPIDWQIRE